MTIGNIDAEVLDRQAPAISASRTEALHVDAVERVIAAMSGRLDQPLSNEEIAEIACFSPYHFSRLFREVTGIPPIQFLYALRLARAKQLLATTELCVTEICYEVGYNSLGTFISRFKELVGVPPNSFRRFACQLAGLRLADLKAALKAACVPPPPGQRLSGAIGIPRSFDGAVFAGLFRRAIPAGQPFACSLTSDNGRYELAIPATGEWYVFAVAVPWSAESSRLLTLDSHWRGRSSLIHVSRSRFSRTTEITLLAPQPTHPPILTTLPLLFAGQWLGDSRVAPTTSIRTPPRERRFGVLPGPRRLPADSIADL